MKETMNTLLPSKHSKQHILNALKSISIDNSKVGDLAPYVDQDFERFLITLNLLPEGNIHKVLEIGSNPYFLTILLKWFRPDLSLELVNFFGTSGGRHKQTIELDSQKCKDLKLQSKFEMPFTSVNCETDIFPFADQSFDCVIFCEVLEHFIADPFHALSQIARVLKLGGHILLSTPNVARLENIARMLNGTNIYDPYSGHGPHGRHNREYTRHEVAWLLSHLGFEPVHHFTSDVHPNQATVDIKKLSLIEGREHDLGQYQFHLWKKASNPASKLRPSWLYRSMSETLDTKPL
jgi:SAM-dependent methyltransferase